MGGSSGRRSRRIRLHHSTGLLMVALALLNKCNQWKQTVAGLSELRYRPRTAPHGLKATAKTSNKQVRRQRRSFSSSKKQGQSNQKEGVSHVRRPAERTRGDSLQAAQFRGSTGADENPTRANNHRRCCLVGSASLT